MKLTPGFFALFVLLPSTIIINSIISVPKHVSRMTILAAVGCIAVIKSLVLHPFSFARTTFYKGFVFMRKPVVLTMPEINRSAKMCNDKHRKYY